MNLLVLKQNIWMKVSNRISTNIETTGLSPKKSLVGFMLSWIVFFLILKAMPLPEGLTVAGKATLAVMAWACIVWIFEAIPVGVTGLLIPMLLNITGAVSKFPVAAVGYTNTLVFLFLAAFIFASLMQAVGLDRRIAITLLHKAKIKTVNGVIWSMFGINFLLSFIIPAATARAATLLPVVNGINSMFGDTPEERAGKKAIVIQTLVYGSMIGGMCIMTAHLPNLILVGLFDTQLKLNLSYFDWFKLQWPYLGMFVLTQWWVQHYFKTRKISIQGGAEKIDNEFEKIPETSRTEWLLMAVFGFVAIMWMTEDLHKIKSHNVALIGLGILFIPGLFNFKWKEIQDRTIWGIFLLLAGAMSLSDAMSSTGLAGWLSDIIYPVAVGHTWWLILLILMLGTHFIRLGMLSNVAAVTMMAPILIAMAPKLGVHPVAFTMLIADTDSFAYLLPTQISAAVVAYSSGVFNATDYLKVGWISVLIAIAYGILVMAPWYAFIGIPLWNPTAPWPF